MLPVPPSLRQSVARVQGLIRTPRYGNDIDLGSRTRDVGAGVTQAAPAEYRDETPRISRDAKARGHKRHGHGARKSQRHSWFRANAMKHRFSVHL